MNESSEKPNVKLRIVGPPVRDELWRITTDPTTLGGKPLIRGLRIGVSDILELMQHGAERKDILEDYSYLEDGDITAALQYAADVMIGAKLAKP